MTGEVSSDMFVCMYVRHMFAYMFRLVSYVQPCPSRFITSHACYVFKMADGLRRLRGLIVDYSLTRVCQYGLMHSKSIIHLFVQLVVM